MNKRVRAFAAVTGLALLMALGAVGTPSAKAAHGPTGVALGSGDSYAAFAAATITSIGPTVINGDLGLHPGTSVTGGPTVNGTQNIANQAALDARNALKAAYNDAAGRTGFTTVAGDELGGKTYVPGVYRGGALDLSTAFPTMTLDAEGHSDAVFIFQAGSTLVTAASTTMNLINGAQACNVFWQVGSSATLGASSVFVGTILSHTSISLGTSATVAGRVLAGIGASTDSPSSDTGALTLLTNTITRPTCVVPSPTATPTAAPTATPTAAPTPTPTVAPVATATATATETPTVAPVATATATATESPTVAPVATATATATPSATPTIAPVATPAPIAAPTVAGVIATPTVAPVGNVVVAPVGTAVVAPVSRLPSTSTVDSSIPIVLLIR